MAHLIIKQRLCSPKVQTHIKEGQRYKLARTEDSPDGTQTHIIDHPTRKGATLRVSTARFAVEIQEDKPQQPTDLEKAIDRQRYRAEMRGHINATPLVGAAVKSATPEPHPPQPKEEEGDCYIRSVLKAECNLVFYWAFVQHACITAANHRISLVRKQTRLLQQLTEDSEDVQERLFSEDREYLPIIDGLVTDVLRIPKFIEQVGLYQSVFEDVATRTSGATNAPVIAAALVAYCFGREILTDLPPLTRDPKHERKMQTTLCDLIQKASGQPLSFFINSSVEDATKRLLAILGD